MDDPRRRRIRVGRYFDPPESEFMTERSHPASRRHVHRADGPTPPDPATETGRGGAQTPPAGAPGQGGANARGGPGTGGPKQAGAGAAEAAAAEAEIERLTGDLETAKGQAAELLAALQRERAEFQNFRRRTTEEREREAGLAGDYLLKKVISIADDFDRAIEARPAELAGNAWAEGIAAIDRKLRGLLESEGVRPIEAVGKAFDPREHEAITSVPATGRPDGEVIAEVQRGYRVRDRILRPALVAVAAGGPADGPGNTSTNGPTNGPTTNDTNRQN
jgi:molecular chaperone GrpE